MAGQSREWPHDPCPREAGSRTPAFREATLAKIKLGRIGSVEDVIGAIVYLASGAASLVTGSAIVVDGGWTAE